MCVACVLLGLDVCSGFEEQSGLGDGRGWCWVEVEKKHNFITTQKTRTTRERFKRPRQEEKRDEEGGGVVN
jgi:hypothetical protein